MTTGFHLRTRPNFSKTLALNFDLLLPVARRRAGLLVHMHGLQLLLAQYEATYTALEAVELLDTVTSDPESEIDEDPSFPIPNNRR